MTSHTTKTGRCRFTAALILTPLLCALPSGSGASDETKSCIETAKQGLLEVPDDRSRRFLGKVQEDTARCRGGDDQTKPAIHGDSGIAVGRPRENPRSGRL